jgi:hypothetical protein
VENKPFVDEREGMIRVPRKTPRISTSAKKTGK